MSGFNNQEQNETHELVFVITSHPWLGSLIEAFAAIRTPSNQFEYGFKKVGKNTWKDYFDDLPASHTELIDILHKIADENLHKRFAAGNPRVSRFYESLTEEYIGKHVRPFLDKVVYQAASFMAEHSIPLYYKGEASERIRENPLLISKKLAETCFHFERLPDKTLYRLEVRYKDDDLYLYMKKARLISQVPCLLLIGRNLLRFDPSWDGKRLLPFFDKEFLVTPKSAEKQFFQKFVQKSILHHPYKAIGFDVHVFEKSPVPVLKIEEHWQGGVVLGLYFRYHKDEIRMDDVANSRIRLLETGDDLGFEKIIRDQVHEKSIASLLKSLGLSKIDGPFFSVYPASMNAMDKVAYAVNEQVTSTVEWLNKNIHVLDENGIETQRKVFEKQYHAGDYSLDFVSEEKNDWFDLHGKVVFGEFKLPFAYLADNILKGNREYLLPDGSIALIPQEWMSKYQDIFKFGKKEGDSWRVKKHHYSVLKNTFSESITFKGFDSEEKVAAYTLPDSVKATFRPYQLIGYRWMRFLQEHQLGGCLADDMGLGKTLQALALLASKHLGEELRNTTPAEQSSPESGARRALQLPLFEETLEANIPQKMQVDGNSSLIVMPLSLIHNWKEEIERFVPSIKVLEHVGPGRATTSEVFNDYHLVLTTYGTVRNDIGLLESYTFRYIILDESQIIKNASSRIFSAIRKLQGQHRLVLTGTPVENSLTDLWSQMSFVNPGMLGTLSFFKKEFVHPIQKKGDDKAADRLRKLINPFILRRTKEQVATELPPMQEKVHYCEMTPEQQTYYEIKKSQIRNAITESLMEKGPEKSRFFILSGLTRLRLIANHPVIIDKSYTGESGKFLEVWRNIENLLSENHKVLIFSQFVKHLNLFRNDFEASDLSYAMLTGSHASKSRKESIDDFQTDQLKKLFLISLKAGGLGLNLTGAGYVFLLDPWWNPAIEKQAINRAHRIGQDKNVFVYRFITRNTVEEKILKLQQRKTNLADKFIHNNNPLKSLTFEELDALI